MVTSFSILQPPFRTAFDPAERSATSADPLALQRNYERLAERIYPDITARMRRIRFLTAIAVAARVCSDLSAVEEDGIAPPWLAFEWHLMEAYGRNKRFDNPAERSGFPGTQKVKEAIRNGEPVGPDNYLKSPQVFGYTGVHKRLAVGLGIVTSRMELDEAGERLLRAWERDQKLDGFLSARDGAGAVLRRKLAASVERALAQGCTSMNGSLTTWLQLCDYLEPDHVGREERAVLYEMLISKEPSRSSNDLDAYRMRSTLLKALESQTSVHGYESDFFDTIARQLDPDLRERLNAIMAYEGLAVVLDRTFRSLVRLAGTNPNYLVTADMFASDIAAAEALGALPAALRRVYDVFVDSSLWTTGDVGPGIDGGIGYIHGSFASVGTSGELFEAALGYHEKVQRTKLPDGRRPWFDRDGHRALLRPSLADAGAENGRCAFLHNYRSATAEKFLIDLGRIR